MTELVAYYRVSTKKQGESGLGLEGQKTAVENYCNRVGGRIKSSYIEVESGKKDDRPELAKAVGHARRAGASLVIAKLDRLSRDPDFLGKLMKAGVEFLACDMPHANKLTIRIMAAVAEQEREAISQRTKAALAAVKRRGTLLGSARPGHWHGREDRRIAGLKKAIARSVAVRQKMAVDAYSDLLPEMSEYRAKGISLAEIAGVLNDQGHTTRRGKRWTAMQVSRVLSRDVQHKHL